MSTFCRETLLISGIFIIIATVTAAQTTVFSRDRFWLVGSTNGPGMRDGPAVAMSGREIRQHMSPLGKPCLGLAATSRPLKFGINTYEHVIEAKNSCSEIVKVEVCYYQSVHCASLTAPSYGKAETILGVAPAIKDFKYQYREAF